MSSCGKCGKCARCARRQQSGKLDAVPVVFEVARMETRAQLAARLERDGLFVNDRVLDLIQGIRESEQDARIRQGGMFSEEQAPREFRPARFYEPDRPKVRGEQFQQGGLF
jgi:hypothetical protein